MFVLTLGTFFFLCVFSNDRPGGREPPGSTSFDETNRIKSFWGRRRKVLVLWFLFLLSFLVLQNQRDEHKNVAPRKGNSVDGHDLVENYAKLARKNVTPPSRKIGRGAKRRGQFCAPPVSCVCAWICEIAREFSTECCNNCSVHPISSFCAVKAIPAGPKWRPEATVLGWRAILLANIAKSKKLICCT